MVLFPAMRPFRLQTYLLLLVLALAVPFLTLSGMIVMRSAATQAERTGYEVIAVARALSLSIDGRVASLQSALEALARSPRLAAGDLAAFRIEMADAAALLGASFSLSDAAGQQVLNTRLPAGAPLPSRAPLEHVAAAVASGHPAVSGVHPAAVDGRLVASIDMPAAAGNPEAPHVLTVAIELPAIHDMVVQQRLPPDWTAWVIDRDARIVQCLHGNAPGLGAVGLGAPAAMNWISVRRDAPEDWVLATSPGGALRYAGYTTSPLTGWTTGLSLPSGSVWAPLQDSLGPLLALGALLTAASLAAAVAVARRIVRPIASLASIAAAPDAAQAKGRIMLAGRIREVDDVARALAGSIAARLASTAALRQSASELQESEAELRIATELNPQVPWTASPDGGLLSVNRRVGALTGISNRERLGDGWTTMVHPDDRAAMQAAWVSSIETGQPFDHEFRVRLARGNWRWSRARATARRDAAGGVLRWYGTTEDIQDRKAAQAALLCLTATLEARVAEEVTAREAVQRNLHQAQRMEALGQLASGIAHDFNNVLQAVQSGLAMIGKQPEDPARVLRLTGMAMDATARGAAITGRLLSLSRRAELRPGPLDAAAVLAHLADTLAHTLGAGVEVRVAAAAGLPSLLVDRGQLETVLINLATNARDAMPRGGTLTLSATAAQDPAGLGPGAYVVIAASDTGDGMDAAMLARVSEPFFTTKEIGRGTGLGLTMARGFAEQSGGALRIASAPGTGTTVQVWLPAAQPGMLESDPAFAAADHASRPSGIAGGSAVAALAEPGRVCVLLVDDDPAVLSILAEQLAEFGYRVLPASGGRAGLDLLQANAEVALLVSDLTMPGMDGIALIQAARRIRLELPAILLTGHSGGMPGLPGVEAGGQFSLMQKPVSGAQVANGIVALLERRGLGRRGLGQSVGA